MSGTRAGGQGDPKPSSGFARIFRPLYRIVAVLPTLSVSDCAAVRIRP
jgi:hypothetical protein